MKRTIWRLLTMLAVFITVLFAGTGRAEASTKLYGIPEFKKNTVLDFSEIDLVGDVPTTYSISYNDAGDDTWNLVVKNKKTGETVEKKQVVQAMGNNDFVIYEICKESDKLTYHASVYLYNVSTGSEKRIAAYSGSLDPDDDTYGCLGKEIYVEYYGDGEVIFSIGDDIAAVDAMFYYNLKTQKLIKMPLKNKKASLVYTCFINHTIYYREESYGNKKSDGSDNYRFYACKTETGKIITDKRAVEYAIGPYLVCRKFLGYTNQKYTLFGHSWTEKCPTFEHYIYDPGSGKSVFLEKVVNKGAGFYLSCGIDWYDSTKEKAYTASKVEDGILIYEKGGSEIAAIKASDRVQVSYADGEKAVLYKKNYGYTKNDDMVLKSIKVYCYTYKTKSMEQIATIKIPNYKNEFVRDIITIRKTYAIYTKENYANDDDAGKIGYYKYIYSTGEEKRLKKY